MYTKEKDIELMQIAERSANKSKDKSTKVGCVISKNGNILSTGFNSFPNGILDLEERHQRPAKYLWTEHAERNAIYNAAKSGIKLEGSTMHLAWFPCMDCARAIVQSGIKELVAKEPNWNCNKWGSDFNNALILLQEANIIIKWYNV